MKLTRGIKGRSLAFKRFTTNNQLIFSFRPFCSFLSVDNHKLLTDSLSSFKLSNLLNHENYNQEGFSPLVLLQQQQQQQQDADADEGFASSSSVDEDQIFEVIRRKRSSHQIPTNTSTSDPIEKSRKLLHEKIKMAPLESILWILSFLWVFYQVFRTGAFDNQVIAGWSASILFGILMVRFSSKKKSRNEDSVTSSDEQLDIHDHQQSKKSDGDLLKRSNEFPDSINRIFGASKTSFRYLHVNLE